MDWWIIGWLRVDSCHHPWSPCQRQGDRNLGWRSVSGRPREGRPGLAGQPRAASFPGELVEQGVFAVMRGPDREVVIPCDAGLGGCPQHPPLGGLGEFVVA